MERSWYGNLEEIKEGCPEVSSVKLIQNYDRNIVSSLRANRLYLYRSLQRSLLVHTNYYNTVRH